MPPMDPRQKALNEMYDVKDGTIQSGLMKGYNPCIRWWFVYIIRWPIW